jgi:hypothetical protein
VEGDGAVDQQGLFNFAIWKMLNILKEFLIFYLFILAGEWFVTKRGYNLFERAWVITVIALSILTFVLWASFGRLFLFF